MRLRITVPLDSGDDLNDLLARKGAAIEERDLAGAMLSTLCLVEPGAFREIHALVQGAKGGGRVEVVALAATADADMSGGIESLAPSKPAAQPQQQMVITLDDPSTQSRAAVAPVARASAAGSSGYAAAPVSTLPAPRRNFGAGSIGTGAGAGDIVVYPKGPVAGLPEEHASRRERFAELDALQPGWQVELRCKGEGGSVDAVFYSPAGQRVGAFAMARRQALQASKEAKSVAT